MKIHKYILKLIIDHPFIFGFATYQIIEDPKISIITIPLVIIAITFKIIDEQFNNYLDTYSEIESIVNAQVVYDNDYPKWMGIKMDLVNLRVTYSLNPIKIKKSKEKLYQWLLEHSNEFPPEKISKFKQEIRDYKLKKLKI